MKCYKCGCPDNEDNNDFCYNCGFELNGNYCTNELCVLNNGDDSIPLCPNECFCSACGSESYFYREGFIQPKTYNHE